MNKEIIVNNKTYLLVEMKSNMSWDKELPNHLTYFIEGLGKITEPFNIPVYDTGTWRENYKIISTTKDITEEQRLSIIEFHPLAGEYGQFTIMPLFLIYGKKQLIGKHTKFKNGTEDDVQSFQSLIQTNGLDINKNYLILQKL